MYSPLDETKTQIRLLHLLPGVEEDPLHCAFSVISLDDGTKFEALSYVWGDMNDRMPIQVEGQEVTVTRNLYQALKSLRYEERKRVVWADGLCINQDDKIERGSQVKLMGDLYSQADCVVCYLGESSEDTDLAMRAMQQMYENKSRHFLEWWKCEGNPKLEGSKASTPWLIRCMMRFFKAPWWTRTWTVQEFVLAKRPVLQYGRTILQAKVALELPLILNDHMFGCCQEFCHVVYKWVKDPENGEDLGYFLEHTVSLLYMYTKFPGSSLFYALALFRGRNAGDTRDKVYGMLGLAKDDFKYFQAIEPNYKLPVEDVFTHATVAEIARTRSLDALSYCYGNRKLNLSSWVPDWTADVTLVRGRLRWVENMNLYNASGDSGANLMSTLKAGTGHWKFPGLEVDNIVQCGRRFDTPFACTQDSSMDEMRSIARVDESGAAPYLKSDYTIEEAFKLSLCGSLEPWFSETPNANGRKAWQGFRRLANEHDLSHVEVWERRRAKRDRPPGSSARNYTPPEFRVFTMFQLFDSLAADRRFIRTQKGYLGFGPASCEIGDSVVVFSGSKVPYVLRRRSVDLSGQPFYEFLGDAYVQGIMDGEAYASIGSEGGRLERFCVA
jgi:hypothetical protein